jgi:hypothetical protein
MYARHVSDMRVFKFTYTDDLSNEMLTISLSKVCKLWRMHQDLLSRLQMSGFGFAMNQQHLSFIVQHPYTSLTYMRVPALVSVRGSCFLITTKRVTQAAVLINSPDNSVSLSLRSAEIIAHAPHVIYLSVIRFGSFLAI